MVSANDIVKRARHAVGLPARKIWGAIRGDWRRRPSYEVIACCPVGQDVVWRIAVETVEDGLPMQLELFDGAGKPLSVDFILFEDQVIQNADLRSGRAKRRMTYSLRLPAATGSFTLIAQHGKRRGKLVVPPVWWDGDVRWAERMRRDAWYRPDYDKWLEAHPEPGSGASKAVTPDALQAVTSDALQVGASDALQAEAPDVSQSAFPDTHVAVIGEHVSLAPQALVRIAQVLREHPEAAAVYTDSDFITADGARVRPLFKPDFSPEYLQAFNYIGDFIVVRRDILGAAFADMAGADDADDAAGAGGSNGAGGADSADSAEPSAYQCALAAAASGGEVLHIPEVLFHMQGEGGEAAGEAWMAEAARQARAGRQASVALRSGANAGVSGEEPGSAANEQSSQEAALYDPAQQPGVDIIIPSKDHADVLGTCVNSILERASYQNYRIIVVENNSTDLATFEYYEQLVKRDPRVAVVFFPVGGEEGSRAHQVGQEGARAHEAGQEGARAHEGGRAEAAAAAGGARISTGFTSNADAPAGASAGPCPGAKASEFNYSRLINFGVAQGDNPYLLLLNNDTEVIEPDFIQLMLQPLLNPQVGVTGAKLFFEDGLVQHAGMLIGPGGTVVHVNQDEEDGWPGYMGRSIYPTNVSAVTGACQMVSRAVFDEVGGYSEQFAVGYNDADFCCKVVRSGRRIMMEPAAKLYHREFTSRGREANDPAKLERWRNERDLFQRTWPRFFEKGDPYGNPNLDPDSSYFSLPE